LEPLDLLDFLRKVRKNYRIIDLVHLLVTMCMFSTCYCDYRLLRVNGIPNDEGSWDFPIENKRTTTVMI